MPDKFCERTKAQLGGKDQFIEAILGKFVFSDINRARKASNQCGFERERCVRDVLRRRECRDLLRVARDLVHQPSASFALPLWCTEHTKKKSNRVCVIPGSFS